MVHSFLSPLKGQLLETGARFIMYEFSYFLSFLFTKKEMGRQLMLKHVISHTAYR